MKYESIKWIVENAASATEDVKEFLILIAQDHPTVFEETVKRVCCDLKKKHLLLLTNSEAQAWVAGLPQQRDC
jgi:hypothetical protein